MDIPSDALQSTRAIDNQETAARFLDEREVADLLSLSVRTLQNWRVRGGGPTYVRISRRCIRYRMTDVLAWADRRQEAHTSEASIPPRSVPATPRAAPKAPPSRPSLQPPAAAKPEPASEPETNPFSLLQFGQ